MHGKPACEPVPHTTVEISPWTSGARSYRGRGPHARSVDQWDPGVGRVSPVSAFPRDKALSQKYAPCAWAPLAPPLTVVHGDLLTTVNSAFLPTSRLWRSHETSAYRRAWLRRLPP
jgi:hypothetical protein